MRSKNVRFVIGLAAVFLVSSCGYHFSGTGAVVPEGLKTISIPVFFNGTNEPYIDVEVTQAVVEEFMTDGRLKVVGLEEADLALIGRLSIQAPEIDGVVYLSEIEAQPGEFVEVTITDAKEYDLMGELQQAPNPKHQKTNKLQTPNTKSKTF